MKKRSEVRKEMSAASNETAMVPALRVVGAVISEHDLDDAVKAILAAKGDAAAGMWHLGRLIADVYDRQLWKLRNGEDGKPRYKGFDAFVHHELGMTSQNAYWLCGVARAYSEGDVRALGTTRLGLLLQVPEGQERDRIRQLATRGATTREIAHEVREVKKREQHQKPALSGRPLPNNAGKTTKRTPTEKLLTAPLPHRLEVPLHKSTGKGRATSLKDKPCGQAELDNGVRLTVVVCADANGRLVLRMQADREADA